MDRAAAALLAASLAPAYHVLAPVEAMKKNPIALLSFAALCLPLGAQSAAVGDLVPDFTFPRFLNGDGRQKLSEFFGQPVLIEYWGTH
ncbi:MAG: hypothetical protein Fur0037_20870 [Planctomycetota bacterium]